MVPRPLLDRLPSLDRLLCAFILTVMASAYLADLTAPMGRLVQTVVTLLPLLLFARLVSPTAR